MKLKMRIFQLVICLIIAGYLSGCKATMHTVGSGGKGNCKTYGQYDKVVKQWYLFWGLLPLQPIIDSKDLVGDNQNYTIRTTTTFSDGLISSMLGIFLFPKIQTIRVSYGNNETEKSSSAKFELLKTLKDLLDSGTISKDEFEKEKSKILGK
jgi:hypothetical protein